MRSCWVLIQHDRDPPREKGVGAETHREMCVEMEALIGIRLLQIKEYLELPEAEKG